MFFIEFSNIYIRMKLLIKILPIIPIIGLPIAIIYQIKYSKLDASRTVLEIINGILIGSMILL